MTSLSDLLEESVNIAWTYLEATGEIEDAVMANRFLSDTVELMIRSGQRNRLMLSNKAISAYQRFREERIIELAPNSVTVINWWPRPFP